MAGVEQVMPEIEWLLFDQYGTLVDMQAGLTEAVTPFLRDKGWRGDPNRFVTWWRRTHFENSMIDALCDRGHTSYREIGHISVSQVMDRSGIDHTPAEVAWLVGRIESLQPFPDVPDALRRLHTRFKLAILSNGDRDMLEAAKPHIRHGMDQTLSVEDAGFFKPHWKTYAFAETALETGRANVLFVANHEFDCVGAKAFGMRAAFINRRERKFGGWQWQPDLAVTSFGALADLLVGEEK